MTLLGLRRLPPAVFLLAAAALAWMIMLFQNQEMPPLLSFLGFISAWFVMMTAMMLPSFTPIASRYFRMIETRPWLAVLCVVAGYLGVWFLIGGAANGVGQLIQAGIRQMPGTALPLAVVIFGTAGIYQFTPLKDQYLTHRRSPFAQLLRMPPGKAGGVTCALESIRAFSVLAAAGP